MEGKEYKILDESDLSKKDRSLFVVFENECNKNKEVFKIEHDINVCPAIFDNIDIYAKFEDINDKYFIIFNVGSSIKNYEINPCSLHESSHAKIKEGGRSVRLVKEIAEAALIAYKSVTRELFGRERLDSYLDMYIEERDNVYIAEEIVCEIASLDIVPEIQKAVIDIIIKNDINDSDIDYLKNNLPLLFQ